MVQLGSAGAMDKITAKMDDARKKKLDEMFQEAMAARGGKAAVSRAAPVSHITSSRKTWGLSVARTLHTTLLLALPQLLSAATAAASMLLR